MDETSTSGEIMRNPWWFGKYRDYTALDDTEMMFQRMHEEGDENYQAFWKRVSRLSNYFIVKLHYENE